MVLQLKNQSFKQKHLYHVVSSHEVSWYETNMKIEKGGNLNDS